MKRKIYLFLVFFIGYAFVSNGQEVISFETFKASSADDAKYQQLYKKYNLGSLDMEEANKLIQSNGQLAIEIDGQSYTFNLAANALRPPQYKLRTLTKQGVTDLPRTANKTFAGKTLDGQYDVRITSDAHFFSAMIVQEQASSVCGDLSILCPIHQDLSYSPYRQVIGHRLVER